MEFGCTRSPVFLILFTLFQLGQAYPYVQCAMVKRTSAFNHEDHFSLTKDYTIARLRRKICSQSKTRNICIPNSGGTKFHISNNHTMFGCEEVKEDARNPDYDLVCQGSYSCTFKDISVYRIPKLQRVEYCCCSQDMCYFSNLKGDLLRELSGMNFVRQLYRRVCNAAIIFTVLALFVIGVTIIVEVIRAGCRWPEPQRNKRGGGFADIDGLEDEDKEEEETVAREMTEEKAVPTPSAAVPVTPQIEHTQEDEIAEDNKMVSQLRKTDPKVNNASAGPTKGKDHPNTETVVGQSGAPQRSKTPQIDRTVLSHGAELEKTKA